MNALSDKPALMAILGMAAAATAGIASWVLSTAHRDSARLFEAAFGEIGFPRDKAALMEFWQRARRERVENAARGAHALAVLDELERHAEAARRVREAMPLIADPSCAPEVACWIIASAIAHWAEVFMPGFDKGVVLDIFQTADEAAFVADVRAYRERGGPSGGRYELRLVEITSGKHGEG